MTRNAIHLPTNFDPMAYEVVDAFDSQPEAGSFISRQWHTFTMPDGTEAQAAHPVHEAYLRLRWLLETSPSSAWYDRGLCDHCGASIRYVVVVRHIPTGDHLAMGETCVDNRIASMDQATWKGRSLTT